MEPRTSHPIMKRRIDRARKAGYRIAQEPRKYDWGTEAFVADPAGYVRAVVSPPK